jgi:hypothetical protein
MEIQYTEKEKLLKEMMDHIYFAGKDTKETKDTKPKHFYHYTNAETLPYIFRKDGIYLRFSRFDRLNDMSEGEEITALFSTAITELKKEKKTTQPSLHLFQL